MLLVHCMINLSSDVVCGTNEVCYVTEVDIDMDVDWFVVFFGLMWFAMLQTWMWTGLWWSQD